MLIRERRISPSDQTTTEPKRLDIDHYETLTTRYPHGQDEGEDQASVRKVFSKAPARPQERHSRGPLGSPLLNQSLESMMDGSSSYGPSFPFLFFLLLALPKGFCSIFRWYSLPLFSNIRAPSSAVSSPTSINLSGPPHVG